MCRKTQFYKGDSDSKIDLYTKFNYNQKPQPDQVNLSLFLNLQGETRGQCDTSTSLKKTQWGLALTEAFLNKTQGEQIYNKIISSKILNL